MGHHQSLYGMTRIERDECWLKAILLVNDDRAMSTRSKSIALERGSKYKKEWLLSWLK